jgi:hypothetical protein
MAANGFPGGEREGGDQIASLDAFSEPLGDVFLSNDRKFFYFSA